MNRLGRRTLRCSTTITLVAITMGAVLSLAGCSISPDEAIPRPAAAPAVAGTSSPGVASTADASPAASAGTVAVVCGPGSWGRIKDHVANPAVALVAMADGCRKATIETTLDSSSVSTAVAICNKAAEVAYAEGVSAISVTAADARQIASGAVGAPCAGQP